MRDGHVTNSTRCCLLYNVHPYRCGGQQLASASFDGEIILWGGDTGKPRIRLHPALQEVLQLHACMHVDTAYYKPFKGRYRATPIVYRLCVHAR
jgi:hypothetical protein